MNAARGIGLLIDGYLRVPRLVRWLMPIVAMSILWWSSSNVPGDRRPSTVEALLHNGMHVVAYAGLAAAWWLAIASRPAGRRAPWRSRAAWLAAVAYGVVDEVHQSYVPGRDCSIADVLADASGAALAIALLRGMVGLSRRWWLPALSFLVAGAASVAVATFVDW